MNLNYKEITTNECANIVNNNNYCHIAFCMNNKPYILPINYQVINDNGLCLQLFSLRSCKKMNILENNRFVNVCIEEVIDNSVISVICYGYVNLIENINDYMVKLEVKIEHLTGRVIGKLNNINNK